MLIVIHGLCMNELQWTSQRAGQPVNHASALSAALGYTPVYVRYNTGLHVSDNGHLLANQLNELLAKWPVPVTELSVLAHSMGGLIARSALHTARQTGQAWPRMLKNLVFLGTPHHGSPLERVGNWVDVLLESTSATAQQRHGHAAVDKLARFSQALNSSTASPTTGLFKRQHRKCWFFID